MTPRRRKSAYSLIALLAASGCAATAPLSPTRPVLPPGEVGGVPPRAVQAAPPEFEHRVIVKFKEGSENRLQALDAGWRELALPRTAVKRLDSAEAVEAEISRLRRVPDVEYAEPDYPVYALLSPNDPQISGQYALDKLQLPAAWDITLGSRGVKVAIIDTGIDKTHPDLAGQVVGGRDFINRDDDPTDDQGHGTHVAGIVAAMTNNGVGVAGTAGGVSLLAVKVLGSDGSGYSSAIAEGIQYAAAQGAKVINMSLGSSQRASTIDQAVAAAINGGAVVVAAAGNDGTSTRSYPGASPGVVCVGSSDRNDNRSTFSNYGTWVSVAAPGSDILSTYRGGRYQVMSGTSMASPYVAGVAALVRSAHPDWSVSQVRNALLTTGDAVRGFESNPSLRRVNALRALGADPAATPPPAPAPTAAPPAPWPTIAPPTYPTPRPWPTLAPPIYPTPRPLPTYAPPIYPTPRPLPTYSPPTYPWPTPTNAPTYPGWPSPWYPSPSYPSPWDPWPAPTAAPPAPAPTPAPVWPVPGTWPWW